MKQDWNLILDLFAVRGPVMQRMWVLPILAAIKEAVSPSLFLAFIFAPLSMRSWVTWRNPTRESDFLNQVHGRIFRKTIRLSILELDKLQTFIDSF